MEAFVVNPVGDEPQLFMTLAGLVSVAPVHISDRVMWQIMCPPGMTDSLTAALTAWLSNYNDTGDEHGTQD